jgi:hypothetical protein
MNWKNLKPFSEKGLRNDSFGVMAADMVMYVPEGTAYAQHHYPKEFFINHVSRIPSKPASQNLLMCDGSVVSKGGGYYKSALHEDDYSTRSPSSQWCWRNGRPDWGPWYYWEGSE